MKSKRNIARNSLAKVKSSTIKRKGVTSIQNFNEMTDADYLLPYPDMETSAGRVQ